MESYSSNSSVETGKNVRCPIQICKGLGNTMYPDKKGHYLSKYCPQNPKAERPEEHMSIHQEKLSKRSAFEESTDNEKILETKDSKCIAISDSSKNDVTKKDGSLPNQILSNGRRIKMRLQTSFTNGVNKAKELLNTSNEKLFRNNSDLAKSNPKTSNESLPKIQTLLKVMDEQMPVTNKSMNVITSPIQLSKTNQDREKESSCSMEVSKSIISFEDSKNCKLVHPLQNQNLIGTITPQLIIETPIVMSSINNPSLNLEVVKYGHNPQQITSNRYQEVLRPVCNQIVQANNNIRCNRISLTSCANSMDFSLNGIQFNQIDERLRFLFDLVNISVELKRDLIWPAGRCRKEKANVKKRIVQIRKRDSSEDKDDEDQMTSSFDGETPAFSCDIGSLNLNLTELIFSKIREFENKYNLISHSMEVVPFVIYNSNTEKLINYIEDLFKKLSQEYRKRENAKNLQSEINNFENMEKKYLETIDTLTKSVNDQKGLATKVNEFISHFVKKFEINMILDYNQLFEMLENFFVNFEGIQNNNKILLEENNYYKKCHEKYTNIDENTQDLVKQNKELNDKIQHQNKTIQELSELNKDFENESNKYYAESVDLKDNITHLKNELEIYKSKNYESEVNNAYLKISEIRLTHDKELSKLNLDLKAAIENEKEFERKCLLHEVKIKTLEVLFNDKSETLKQYEQDLEERTQEITRSKTKIDLLERTLENTQKIISNLEDSIKKIRQENNLKDDCQQKMQIENNLLREQINKKFSEDEINQKIITKYGSENSLNKTRLDVKIENENLKREIEDSKQTYELNDKLNKTKISDLENEIKVLKNQISTQSSESESENDKTIQDLRKTKCEFINCMGEGNTNGISRKHRTIKNCPLALKAKINAAQNNQAKTYSAAIPFNCSHENLISDLRTEILREKTNNIMLRDEIDKNKNDNKSLEKYEEEIKKIQNELLKEISEKTRLEEERKNLEMSIETLSNDCDKYLKTIKDLQSENEQLLAEIKGWEDTSEMTIDENYEISKLKEENTKLTDQLNSVNSNIEQKSLELKKKNAKCIENQTKITAFLSEIESMKKTIEEYKISEANYQSMVSTLERQISSDMSSDTTSRYTSEISMLKQQKDLLESEKIKLEQENAKMKASILARNGVIKKQSETWNIQNAKLNDLENEKKELMEKLNELKEEKTKWEILESNHKKQLCTKDSEIRRHLKRYQELSKKKEETEIILLGYQEQLDQVDTDNQISDNSINKNMEADIQEKKLEILNLKTKIKTDKKNSEAILKLSESFFKKKIDDLNMEISRLKTQIEANRTEPMDIDDIPTVGSINRNIRRPNSSRVASITINQPQNLYDVEPNEIRSSLSSNQTNTTPRNRFVGLLQTRGSANNSPVYQGPNNGLFYVNSNNNPSYLNQTQRTSFLRTNIQDIRSQMNI